MTSASASGELTRRAVALGVEVQYEDVDGKVHAADPEVLATVVDVLAADAERWRETTVPHVHVVGAPAAPVVVAAGSGREETVADAAIVVEGADHAVHIDRGADGDVVVHLPDDLPVGCHDLIVATSTGDHRCLVVVPPHAMPGLDPAHRWSALFAPAYALWETHDPLPSFAHLGRLASAIREHGVDMVATLPIYATFLDDPYDPSPYSPISRLHWNEVYLADGGLPEAPVPGASEMVDWRLLAERRRQQLLDAAEALDGDGAARLDRFVASHPDVAHYARFRAGRDGRGAGDALVERSHQLAQMLCTEQLSELANGDGAGLSLDLPIGSHPDGYERWAHPELFAPATAVGAPPDTFFREGQNWGFPPQLPGAMRASGYDLWRRMIERAGSHCALLRIDHVMAVHRLWWVPDGVSADRGVYVRVPRDEVLAVIAATAASTGVGVVGENLGTVPPEVGDALDRWGVLGMYEEQFHMGGDAFADVPTDAVAGVRTHDMAAFAAFAAETDLGGYRSLLSAAGVDPQVPLYDAVLARLAASGARMAVADLDDLREETRPHNLPGRVVPGIWQRRLDRPLNDVLADPTVARRLDLLGRTS